VLLLIIFSVRGLFLSIEYEFYGNPKKIKESEEIMINHLDSKGTEEEIFCLLRESIISKPQAGKILGHCHSQGFK
jgi:hypothetical protein